MAIPTIKVSDVVVDQNGMPLSGVKIYFELNRLEKYNGIIIPDVTNVATTDAEGKFEINLFPNELGSEGSEYKVTIVGAAEGFYKVVYAAFPAADTSLWSVFEDPKYYDYKGVGPVLTANLTKIYNDTVLVSQQVTADKNYVDQVAANVATAQTQINNTAADVDAKAAQVTSDAAAVQTALTTVNTKASEVSTDATNVEGWATQVSADKATVASDKTTTEGYKTAAEGSATVAAQQASQAQGFRDATLGYYTQANDAKVAAETAQTASEAARDASQTARNTSVSASQTASTAATNAATSETNAQGAASSASTARDEAVVAAASADFKNYGLGSIAKSVSNSDFNSLTNTGFYDLVNCSNSPDVDSDHWNVIHTNTYATNTYQTQYAIAGSGSFDDGRVFVRSQRGGAGWRPWNKIWTTEAAPATLAANQGSQKLPNGLTLRWGLYTNTTAAANTWYPITFSQAFTTECYNVSAVAAAGSDPANHSTVLVKIPTTTGFNVSFGSAGVRSIYWYAVGV